MPLSSSITDTTNEMSFGQNSKFFGPEGGILGSNVLLSEASSRSYNSEQLA